MVVMGQQLPDCWRQCGVICLRKRRLNEAAAGWHNEESIRGLGIFLGNYAEILFTKNDDACKTAGAVVKRVPSSGRNLNRMAHVTESADGVLLQSNQLQMRAAILLSCCPVVYGNFQHWKKSVEWMCIASRRACDTGETAVYVSRNALISAMALGSVCGGPAKGQRCEMHRIPREQRKPVFIENLSALRRFEVADQPLKDLPER